MTSARREKNKGSGSAHSQQSPLFWSHTHRASYTPASSLLCFNACQRRLKRPEVHNSEENKQADENMGSNREKKRREYNWRHKWLLTKGYKRLMTEQSWSWILTSRHGGIFWGYLSNYGYVCNKKRFWHDIKSASSTLYLVSRMQKPETSGNC